MKFIKDLKGHASGIYALSSDSSFLFSGSGDGMVAGWDLETLEPSPFSIKVGKPVYSVLVKDEVMLIGQGSGGIHVVDRQGKKEVRNLQYHTKGVFSLMYNPLTNHYYSAGGEGGLAIFDGDNYRLIIHIPLSGNKLRRLILNPSGDKLFIGGSDGYIHIIETQYFNELGSFKGHEGGVYALGFNEAGHLVSGGRDAHIRIWNLGSDQPEEVGAIPAHNYAIYDLMNYAGGFVTGSRDRLAKLWDGEFKNPQRLIADRTTTHSNSVNTLHVNGDFLFTAGDDRVIKVWSA